MSKNILNVVQGLLTSRLNSRTRRFHRFGRGEASVECLESRCLLAAARPSLSIADVSITEGESGGEIVVVNVSIDTASQLPVTAIYATHNRTATAGVDFQSRSGTVTIPPGQTSAAISLTVLSDTIDELSETFDVVLSTPVNANIAKVIGTVTIIDNDAPPVVSVRAVTAGEGDSGTTAATVRVSLSEISAFPVTVRYQTQPDTAAAGSDFVATTGLLTIPAGALFAKFSVSIVGDVLDENDETFRVELSAPTNATLCGLPGIITITDNDLPPMVSIANTTVSEGDTGTATATIRVSLSAASGLPVTMVLCSRDITATSRTDYTLPDGTLTIPAGQTSGTISFGVMGDTSDEPNEAFRVVLSQPINASFGKSWAIVTINDDDGTQLPLFQMSDMKYLGAFRVPRGTVGSDTFEFGGNALTFNPANHSLFMASNFDDGLNIAEVEIPALLSSTGVLSSMSVASVLQPFVNLSSLLTVNAGGTTESPILGYENLSLGGLLVAGNGLTGGMYMGYNGAEPDDSTNSHFRTTSLNLASLSLTSFTGLIDIRSDPAGASGRVRGGYMAEVPEQWRAWIGANYVTGAAAQNRIQFSSSGPALFGFDALNPQGSSDNPLVYYPYSHALQWVYAHTAAPQLTFNGTTQINGMAFVPGTRSVIFLGSNGVSSIGYGVGPVFNDRARPYQGFHSQNGNYQYQIWAYDIDDFMAVRNGTMTSWQIKPTSVMNFSLPTRENSKYLGGTAFDPATGRLYVSQKFAGPGATPVIHVYQLGIAPTSGVLSARATSRQTMSQSTAMLQSAAMSQSAAMLQSSANKMFSSTLTTVTSQVNNEKPGLRARHKHYSAASIAPSKSGPAWKHAKAPSTSAVASHRPSSTPTSTNASMDAALLDTLFATFEPGPIRLRNL